MPKLIGYTLFTLANATLGALLIALIDGRYYGTAFIFFVLYTCFNSFVLDVLEKKGA